MTSVLGNALPWRCDVIDIGTNNFCNFLVMINFLDLYLVDDRHHTNNLKYQQWKSILDAWTTKCEQCNSIKPEYLDIPHLPRTIQTTLDKTQLLPTYLRTVVEDRSFLKPCITLVWHHLENLHDLPNTPKKVCQLTNGHMCSGEG